QPPPPAPAKRIGSLGNVSLRGTALDRTLLPARDDSGVPQVVGQVGDTTDELAMVGGVYGAFRGEVRDRAATWRHGVGDPRIATTNGNGGAQIGVRTAVFGVGHPVAVGVGLWEAELADTQSAA